MKIGKLHKAATSTSTRCKARQRFRTVRNRFSRNAKLPFPFPSHNIPNITRPVDFESKTNKQRYWAVKAIQCYMNVMTN